MGGWGPDDRRDLSELLAEVGTWRRTESEWAVVRELLGQLADAWRRGDRAQFLQAEGQLETATLRVRYEPGPEQLPEPPEVTEERNHLIDELDLDLKPAPDDDEE